MRGRRPWVVNGRIDGSGRACQRPRTSSVEKCFSCEGALAGGNSFFKFFGNYKTLALRWAERVFTPSEARAERGRKSEEIKTARAWPRAAQHKEIACFNKVN